MSIGTLTHHNDCTDMSGSKPVAMIAAVLVLVCEVSVLKVGSPVISS